MRDRAAVLSTRLPWPLDDGGRIAIWQTVWAAAQEYETTLICLVPRGTENDPLPEEMLNLGIEVIRVPHRPPPTPIAAWQGIAGRWPYTLARYQNRGFAATLAEFARRRKPSFFLVNNLHLGPYVESMAGVPMILRQQNIEYRWMARYAAELPPGPRRWYAEIQAERLRQAEAELCERSALVLAIQDGEAAILRKLAPAGRTECLPVGLDATWYPEPDPAEPPIVLMAGTYSWPPNSEGALVFLRQGWSRVKQQVPSARLRIAGKDPPPILIEEAGRAGAEVTGYVESMPAEFARATVLLVPLWSGAGVRVKIMEAMMAGVPVVSTTIGEEGLELEPGAEFLLSDTPEGLAGAVIELLNSDEKRRELSRHGRETARARWSMEAVARIQNRYCREVSG